MMIGSKLDSVNENVGTNRIEISPGQCVVIQCNFDIGRMFIDSLMGDVQYSGCQISFRQRLLSVIDQQSARGVGICRLDEGLYTRLKVGQYLRFWFELYEVESSMDELLKQFGLEGKINEKIARLTYSEKRRLSFARSVLHGPELVIWEDPEQNLDLESCMMVRKAIADMTRKDKAVLVTCSTLEQALSVSSHIYKLTSESLSPIVLQGQVEVESSETETGMDEEELEIGEDEASAGQVKLSKLMVKMDDKYIFIDPADIYFVESNDGIMQLYTKRGQFACGWSLTEMEEKLKSYRFYRCHRSYIVNLDCMTELVVWSRNSYSLVLSDEKKTRIPLSRVKFEELKTIVGL
ncbi:LytTR family transcriptional regulator DNA-binding domain-containing protein [Paenibacillus sp. GCM10027627]|uniref:LytTR family transcriptional regulator DNA-binding domain-containing protein n=1 Tax=unclassified Paenibacillus TaxID=185978 RepID=UPI003640C1DA